MTLLQFNEVVFLPSETVTDNEDVEKYETTSPFYQDSNSSTNLNLTQYESHSMTNMIELSASPVNSCISEYFNGDDNSHTKNSTTLLRKAKNKQSIFSANNSSLKDNKIKRNSTSKRCNLKRKYRKKNAENDIILDDNTYSSADEGDGRKTSIKTSRRKLRYHCEPCKKFFYEIYRYEGHMKQVHEGVQKPFQCRECDKIYSKYKNLTYHIAENHTEKSCKSYRCEECNKNFKTNETLRQHMRNQHSELKIDKFREKPNADSRELTRTICDQCGFIAAHQYTLAQHIKNKHTESQKIKCEHCPKIFKSQSYLKYHMLSHNPNSIKPFQCNECQMAFGRRTLLNIHKRTHIKYDERLKCDFEDCMVRFVKPADKRLHMRLVHLKVKKHICDVCGEAFGAMQTLRHHRYIHTGEKPYKCTVCGQGFRQQTAMKTHRKAHFDKKESTAQQLIKINNIQKA